MYICKVGAVYSNENLKEMNVELIQNFYKTIKQMHIKCIL